MKEQCVFSPDLLNYYSEARLRELEVLSELITGGSNLNNIRYDSVDSRQREETTKTPEEGIEGK